MVEKKKYYAVAEGHKPGIYDRWYGENGAKINIDGFSNAVFKKFSTLEDAKSWLIKYTGKMDSSPDIGEKSFLDAQKNDPLNMLALTVPEKADGSSSQKKSNSSSDMVIIYTDGGCIRNPGPGGFGAVLKFKDYRKEISGGFRKTTNNRMELMACIESLKALKKKCRVTIFSDSKYVVNSIEKGWVYRWRSNGWMRTRTEPAENVDLWEQLLDFCDRHHVEFKWVKGHAGNPENERCDQLAKENASKPDLPPDTAYERGKTKAI